MSSYYYGSADGLPERLELLERAPVVAFDVESTGSHIGTDLPVGFSLAYEPNSAYYAHMGDEYLLSVLSDPSRLKIAHYSSFDRSMMKKAGITIDNLCDTMIAAHLLEEPVLSLKSLALTELQLNIISYAELGKRILDMTMDELLHFSGPHSRVALMLWPIYEKRMNALGLLDVFWNIEMPLVPVLSDMELNGVMVDPVVLGELDVEFSAKIEALNQALCYWSGVTDANFNSPDQVADIFYKRLRLTPPWQKTRGGRPSVNVSHLKQTKNDHPVLPIYYMFKSYMTLKNSYLKSLGKQIQADGRVYGSFNQTRTRTSRLSSSNPNLQKIPKRTAEGKRIRRAFIAPEGKVLLKSDYDLIELKMMAMCSGDKNMLDAFRAGRDIHEETATRVFGGKDRRDKGKTLNYRIIFGGGGIAERDMFFAAYPRVKAWIDEASAGCRRVALAKTLGGRRRTIHEHETLAGASPHAKVLAHGDREAVSTMIQGSSAEVVKVGMRKAWEKVRDTEVKMVLQGHDEVVYEVPEDIVEDVARVIKPAMTYTKYEIPLTVSLEVGKSWGEMEELKV